MNRRHILIIESTLFFVLLPLALFLIRLHLQRIVVPIMIVAALGCVLVLSRSQSFTTLQLIDSSGLRGHLKSILRLFIPCAILLGLGMWLLRPDLFFVFPARRPVVWAIVLVLYPLLAAWPQEIIFRAFFMHRYAPLWGTGFSMIAANALCFGLAHLFYGNAVAPILAAAGGLLFAWRYQHTQSLLAIAIEHGLWGNLIFTVGLGQFFYSGAIH